MGRRHFFIALVWLAQVALDCLLRLVKEPPFCSLPSLCPPGGEGLVVWGCRGSRSSWLVGRDGAVMNISVASSSSQENVFRNCAMYRVAFWELPDGGKENWGVILSPLASLGFGEWQCPRGGSWPPSCFHRALGSSHVQRACRSEGLKRRNEVALWRRQCEDLVFSSR